MRIGYLLSEFPTPGHSFMLREVRGLRRLGVSIDVACLRRPSTPADRQGPEERAARDETFYVQQAGIRRFIGAHLSTLVHRPVRYLRTLAGALVLGRTHPARTVAHVWYFAEAVVAGHWFRARGITHVHSHFASTVGLFVTRLFPISLSITLHGPDEFEHPDRFHLTEKVQESRFIVAISHYARSQAWRYSHPDLWNRVEVVGLGVDTAQLTPRPFRPNPQPFRLVCAGRLAAVKGHPVLLQALDLLRHQHPDLVLHLAGEGPERDTLRAIVARRRLDAHVVFEGLLGQDALQHLYDVTDAFVLSSFAEGVPVVLMEAMARGIPCISTHVNGVAELITDDRSGLLVAPGDPEALAHAIERLLLDEDYRRQIATGGRAAVEDRFDIHRNVSHLWRVFEARLQADDRDVSRSPRVPTATDTGDRVTESLETVVRQTPAAAGDIARRT